jgi:hypothetical protein
LSKPRPDHLQLLLDLRPRLTPEPNLQAARHWRLRPRWALHHDLAIYQTDKIAPRSGCRPFDANTCAFASEKYLAPPPIDHTNLAQPIDPLKLLEDPLPILAQKCRYFLGGSIDWLHDLDAVEAHPNAQLTG